MGSLLLSLLVIGLGLGVLLFAGSLFLQGYVYTEPWGGLYWGAPAAASALFAFFLLWCLMVANSATASPSEVPYDTFLRFNPKEDLTSDPVPEVVAIQKNGKEIVYKLQKQPFGPGEYREKNAVDRADPNAPSWNPDKVKAIRIKYKDQDLVFDLSPTGTGANRQFVNAATGYTIMEYNPGGLTGIPYAFRWSRFLLNVFLNLFHVTLWFICLWLLLRYQWSHALGLAVAFWLIFTVVLMPMLLDSAAQVAVERRSPQGTKVVGIAWDEVMRMSDVSLGRLCFSSQPLPKVHDSQMARAVIQIVEIELGSLNLEDS